METWGVSSFFPQQRILGVLVMAALLLFKNKRMYEQLLKLRTHGRNKKESA